MSPSPAVRIYMDMPRTGSSPSRVLHSPAVYNQDYMAYMPNCLTPIESVGSVADANEFDIADIAEAPDIPLRARRFSSVTDMMDAASKSSRPSPRPTVMEQVVSRNHDFVIAHRGPINPNYIETRSEKRISIDEGVGGLQSPTDQSPRTPEQAVRPSSRRGSVASAVASASSRVHGKSRPSSSASNRVADVLAALQIKGAGDGEGLEPLAEEDVDPSSFDLVAPVHQAPPGQRARYSLERRSEAVFSRQHLAMIFSEQTLVLKFSDFLSTCRPASVPLLTYYLDAVKAIKALNYSNAVLEALGPLEAPHDEFSAVDVSRTQNEHLKTRAEKAFEALVRDELPAYVTHTWIQMVSASIRTRITGTMPPHLVAMSEGLAEVFCLTDPSRHDNPIIFASEQFHRTTQYGMDHVIGRNCRFLQGPTTNPFSIKRIRDKVVAGKEHYETLLNYRRDGSPFMNLLMVAPLLDSRGQVRYFIGAQVDVSGLAKDCVGLEGLQRLAEHDARRRETGAAEEILPPHAELARDQFRELSAMFSLTELETVRKHGGSLHRVNYDCREGSDGPPEVDSASLVNWHKPRLVIRADESDSAESVPSTDSDSDERATVKSCAAAAADSVETATPGGASAKTSFLPASSGGGRLLGVYEHYLLVRPYPEVRILFASPSLRIPGLLLSPFLSRIGGSGRVRNEVAQAFAEGIGVTAKIRWLTRGDPEGTPRWIHCTPLIGAGGKIGVWMVVVVKDGMYGQGMGRGLGHAVGRAGGKLAPPVEAKLSSDGKQGAVQSSRMGNKARGGAGTYGDDGFATF